MGGDEYTIQEALWHSASHSRQPQAICEYLAFGGPLERFSQIYIPCVQSQYPKVHFCKIREKLLNSSLKNRPTGGLPGFFSQICNNIFSHMFT